MPDPALNNTAPVPSSQPPIQPSTDVGTSNPLAQQGGGVGSAMPTAQPDVAMPDTSAPAMAQVTGPSQAPDLGQLQTAQPVEKPSMWKAILQGALVGLAGAAGQRHFGGGLGAGARGYLQYQEQQKQDAMQQQEFQQQQQTTQAKLALLHTQIAEETAKYGMMPKNWQDVINQASMKMGATLQSNGITPLFTGSHEQVMAQQQAHMGADANAPLRYVSTMNPDGTFSLYQIPDPDKLNAKPMDVTIGYDPKSGGAITKTYQPGTIKLIDAMRLEAQSAQNYVAYLQKSQLAKDKSAVDVANAGAKKTAELNAQHADDASQYQKLVEGDVTGWKPPQGLLLNQQQVTMARDRFVGSKAYTTAQEAERSYQMADKAFAEYKAANGNLPTGAQSMLMLSQHLQTTFGSVKGSRVTKDMIKEHLGARSVPDDALVATQKLINGDQLSPKQWAAFHQLIGQSRGLAWANAIQSAHAMGLPVTSDIVPSDVVGGRASSSATNPSGNNQNDIMNRIMNRHGVQ